MRSLTEGAGEEVVGAMECFVARLLGSGDEETLKVRGMEWDCGMRRGVRVEDEVTTNQVSTVLAAVERLSFWSPVALYKSCRRLSRSLRRCAPGDPQPVDGGGVGPAAAVADGRGVPPAIDGAADGNGGIHGWGAKAAGDQRQGGVKAGR